jgi:hypothetical protein
MPKREHSLVFSNADLAANRDGYLTDGQRKFIQAISDKDEKSLTFLRTGWGVIGSICTAIAVLFGNPSLLMVGGGLLLLYTIVTIVQHRSLENLQNDLEDGAVLTVEGVRNYGRGNWARKFVIGTTELYPFSFKMYPVLQLGDAYRVFYLPRTKYIVGAEHLVHPRNAKPDKT